MPSSNKYHDLRVISSGPKTECLIIIVSDLDNAEPEKWCKNGNKSWIQTLLETATTHARALCFDNTLKLGDNFSWQELFDNGVALLNAIYELRRDPQILQCPIHLIGIGLGGIVLKDAIRIAHQQQQHFRDLLYTISGVVFIGTPHSKLSQDPAWERLVHIPRLAAKLSGKQRLSRADTAKLAEICERFESIDLDRPLVCACETQPTTVDSLKGLRKKNVLLIGKEFGSIGSKGTFPLECDGDYTSLHLLGTGDQCFIEVTNCCRSAIAAAQFRIQLQSKQTDGAIDRDRFTVRSHHSVISDEKQEDTGQGTTGSTTASYQVIRMAQEFEEVPRRKPRLPCYLLKNLTRNNSFYGREDVLKKLEEILLPKDIRAEEPLQGVPQTFSLCGSGGLGKSSIAAEFVFKNIEKFDAVFWLNADEKPKLREGFSQIAQQLGLEDEKEAQDQTASTNLAKGWLANPLKDPAADKGEKSEEAKWLIVFDNVDRPEDLYDFWPQFGQGSILITSRDPLAKASFYSTSSGIDLLPFSQKDTALFLTKESGNELNSDGSLPPDALRLANRLGGLPLGLVQYARYMRRKDYTCAEFLKQYNERNLPELVSLQISGQHSGYSHTVASVWAFEELEQDSLALLEVLSLLDPDGIKEDILIGSTESVNISFHPLSLEQYQDARADLTGRSLISRNKKKGELSLHRLTQDAARARMSTATPPRTRTVFESVVTILHNAWPFVPLESRHTKARWAACEALVPHLIKLQELYVAGNVDHGEQTETELDFAKLLTDAAWYWTERSGEDKLFVFLDLAQSICERDSEATLEILSDVYYARGAEAAETNKKEVAWVNNLKFLETRQAISKTSKQKTRDSRLAQAYNQAANAYLDRGLIAEAIELYLKALGVFRSLDNYKESNDTIVVANLATAYWLQEKYEEASEILLRNLRARETECGADEGSYRPGRLLHVLGNVRASQGQLRESFDYHLRALNKYRVTVGENHHRTADLCCKTAEHFLRFGSYDEARVLLNQALKIYSQHSWFQPELARTKFLLSNTNQLSGQSSEAIKLRSEALDHYKALTMGVGQPVGEITEEDFDKLVTFASR